MQHNIMCSCSECTTRRLGGIGEEIAPEMGWVPPPDDGDDEDVVWPPAPSSPQRQPDSPDELAVRVGALELAGKRREAELRAAYARIEALEEVLGGALARLESIAPLG